MTASVEVGFGRTPSAITTNGEYMEQERLVKEFSNGVSEVVVRVVLFTTKTGRSWPTTQTGRYYTKDGEKRFMASLRIDDIPESRSLLHEAYMWQKANPHEAAGGDKE